MIFEDNLLSVSQNWASLIFQKWLDFNLKLLFNTAPTASKNNALF